MAAMRVERAKGEWRRYVVVEHRHQPSRAQRLAHEICGEAGQAMSGDRRSEWHHAEARRGVDTQVPARSRLQVACGPLGLLEIGQEPRTALVVGAPDFREADLARGAVQQTRTEPVLECLDMLADHAG